MVRLVRSFLAVEVLVFGIASLIHTGVLMRGYEHSEAATAEAVIAIVLAVGLIAASVRPASSRGIGLAAQAFALLGTMVGLFTIAIGIGPRTPLDLTLHSSMIALLVTGVVLVFRQRVRMA
jgi:hypothetical protein